MNYYKSTIFLLIIVSATITCCKTPNSLISKEQRIADNLKEIDFDFIKDTLDLNFLNELIGNSNLILLGEQDHGDGNSIKLKSSIVKHLIKYKGFNKIVFESDFFALNIHSIEGHSNYKNSEYYLNNIYSVWSDCYVFKELINSLNEDIQIMGIDPQLTGQSSKELFINYLKENKIQLELTNQIQSFLDHYKYSEYNSPVEYKLKTKAANEILKTLTCKNKINSFDNLNNEFNQIIITNLIYNCWLSSNSKLNIKSSFNYRDSLMARNLSWVINNSNKTDKIIVWSANGHIMKNADGIMYNKQPLKPLGTWLNGDKMIKDKLYSIGITSSEGEYSWPSDKSSRSVNASISDKSLENKIDNSLEYGYLDLNDENNNGKFNSHLFSHQYALKQKWHEAFDLVVYVKNQIPCIIIEK